MERVAGHEHKRCDNEHGEEVSHKSHNLSPRVQKYLCCSVKKRAQVISALRLNYPVMKGHSQAAYPKIAYIC